MFKKHFYFCLQLNVNKLLISGNEIAIEKHFWDNIHASTKTEFGYCELAHQMALLIFVEFIVHKFFIIDILIVSIKLYPFFIVFFFKLNNILN